MDHANLSRISGVCAVGILALFVSGMDIQAQTFSPLLTYEFDKPTLAENGWQEPTGGFSGQPAGSAALIDFPPRLMPSSFDQKGLAVTVQPGQVAFLYPLSPVDTVGEPVMLRLTVLANSPNAAVALATLRGNLNDGTGLDGSIATHIPATAASFVDEERRIVLVYEPDSGNLITPVIQVAATGQDENVTVYVDKLDLLKLTGEEYGHLPYPLPTPTPTPTLVPTPTSTPTPVPPPVTITVPLSGLPAGAKPLEMVLIHAGTFTMGSPADERSRYPWEWLPHQVTLSHDFYIGQYEVTQAQWEAVMESNPSHFHDKPNHPVEQVTWLDCAAFCNRLSEREGLTPVYDETTWETNWNSNGYRLPTEAEWEYACRAGTAGRFSFGDALECADVGGDYCEPMGQSMWWWGNNTYEGVKSGTKEVGLKLPNPWWLYDMHGNVWEWCNDWWEDPTDRDSQVDPLGPPTGSYRVGRGGGWSGGAWSCRSAYRSDREPGGGGYDLGLRIVLPKTQ
ncbi:MAG TPA: formylglycine-generating enzyme family protein [bacterium]|nr:formylglycine-generating enzyme family protein [bacterium]